MSSKSKIILNSICKVLWNATSPGLWYIFVRIAAVTGFSFLIVLTVEFVLTLFLGLGALYDMIGVRLSDCDSKSVHPCFMFNGMLILAIHVVGAAVIGMINGMRIQIQKQIRTDLEQSGIIHHEIPRGSSDSEEEEEEEEEAVELSETLATPTLKVVDVYA
jgi:hypothetical protein